MSEPKQVAGELEDSAGESVAESGTEVSTEVKQPRRRRGQRDRSQIRQDIQAIGGGWEMDEVMLKAARARLAAALADKSTKPREIAGIHRSLIAAENLVLAKQKLKLETIKVEMVGDRDGYFPSEEVGTDEEKELEAESAGQQRTIMEMVANCQSIEELEVIQRVSSAAATKRHD